MLPAGEVALTLISGVLAAIGALGLVSQVVLIREFFAVFAGNEISAGSLLSGWLFFEGLGAWLTGRFLIRSGRLPGWLFCAGVVSGFSSIISVVLTFYSPRLFGLLPGEVLSLPALLAINGLVVAIPAASHGALFTLGAQLFSNYRAKSGVSRAYMYEGLGTFSAGLLLYFLFLARLSGIGIVGLFSGIMFLLLALLDQPRVRATTLIIAGTLLIIFSVQGADGLVSGLMSRVWHGQRVLSVRESAYGKLATLARENQRLVLYDGMAVLTVPPVETATYEQLVQVPMLLHNNPRKVLILGAGPGVLVQEVLKNQVEQVLTVQIDPVLFQEIARAGGEMISRLVVDPRVRLITADPRRFLEVTDDSFDVIIIAQSAPMNLNSSRLFTVEFFQRCADRLKAGGMVITYSPGSGERLFSETGVIAGIRQATLKRVFPACYSLGLDFPLFIGSKQSLAIEPETLTRRLATKKLNLSVLTPKYLDALLDPFRQLQFQNGVVLGEQVSTDLIPRELFFNLLRETRRVQPGFARMLSTIPGTLTKLWLPLLIITVILALVCGLVSANFARGFGIVSSGFSGAAISTLTIMIYQLRFGSVYSGVALLLASFMLGTVAGAQLSARAGHNIVPGRRIGAVLFFIGDLLMVVVSGLMFLAVHQGGRLALMTLLLVTGAILGWEFGVASIERQTQGARAGETAGILSVLDFTGGALGGVFSSVLIVPVSGLLTAIALITILKLVSALSQLLTFSNSRFKILRV